MSSFQDLIDACSRVKDSTTEFEVRASLTTAKLQQDLTRLSALARGNRTAERAVEEVRMAVRELITTTVHLHNLQRELGSFIAYVRQ